MQKHNFNIGDEVSVLDDTITGKIIDIVHTLITICDENGFHYKHQYYELVKKFDFKESFIDDYKGFKKNNVISKKIIKTLPKSQELVEVDLHIHQITKSNKYLSNYEMLSRQLNYAEEKIKLAIKNNLQKVVFIHGVGQGVLKRELYKLFKKYKVEINDANYKKYGKGATEIYIFRNN